MNRYLRLASFGAALLVSINCGGGGTENNDPVPGPLSVVLTSPNGDDAAMILTLTTPVAPTSLTAGSGLALFLDGAPGATTTRVVLTGTMTTGSTLLTIQVPDTRADEDYSVTVDQVASTTYALRSVTGYAASVEK